MKVRRIALGFATMAIVAVALYITGIGCPIKFCTGISCPGCGMTRAWLSLFSLRPDLAFAYHPLYWMAPLVFALVYFKHKIEARLFRALVIVALVSILTVWIARLLTPRDAAVLCSSIADKDIVSIQTPPWLMVLQAALA